MDVEHTLTVRINLKHLQDGRSKCKTVKRTSEVKYQQLQWDRYFSASQSREVFTKSIQNISCIRSHYVVLSHVPWVWGKGAGLCNKWHYLHQTKCRKKIYMFLKFQSRAETEVKENDTSICSTL
ncbi:hypothetical protein XENTR_v10002958 [Xenopus tropicalis]|nr:hypothetical protein XENTR_v10002958 [Xenopus tropicalis]